MAKSRFLPWCQSMSTSWSMTTGCGFHGGRPPENYPLPLQVTDRCVAHASAKYKDVNKLTTAQYTGPDPVA